MMASLPQHCCAEYLTEGEPAPSDKPETTVEPCPNQCEIGTIPRGKVDQHLRKCPLQLVECEFAKIGCQERVLRRDLTHHMEEGAKHHLRCMSLFNLTLTMELNQQMAKKDQQMAKKDQQLTEKDQQLAEKDQQLAEKDQQMAEQMAEKDHQIANLHEQNRKMQGQLQQQGKQTRKLIEKLDRNMSTYGEKIDLLQSELELRDKQIKEQVEKWQDLPKQQLHVGIDEPQFQVHQDLAITAYSEKKRCPNAHPHGETHYYESISNQFYSKHCTFEFNIDILHNGDIRGCFRLLEGDDDDRLQWPIKVTIKLLLINQLRGYGHHLTVVTVWLYQFHIGRWKVIKDPLVNSADLQFDAQRHTLYLKNDCLHFRLYLRVN